MISSGTTAKATTTDAVVDVLDSTTALLDKIVIINEGGVPGFFSIDGGTTWGRLPAGPSSIQIDLTDANRTPQNVTVGLKVKRVAGGSNLSDIWAWAN